MVRRLLRFVAATGLVAALVILVRRTMSLRDESRQVVPSPDPWRPIREADLMEGGKVAAPATDTTLGAEAEGAAAVALWLPPSEDGSAPATHPIKAKASSHIYHLPGMVNYGRTHPDRCYATEEAAQADGYTKAKR
ncbi:MAG: hypothetical protein ACRDZ8_10820 [Acidimicrobiales bacterium]